jgi:hypothetical protein
MCVGQGKVASRVVQNRPGNVLAHHVELEDVIRLEIPAKRVVDLPVIDELLPTSDVQKAFDMAAVRGLRLAGVSTRQERRGRFGSTSWKTNRMS